MILFIYFWLCCIFTATWTLRCVWSQAILSPTSLDIPGPSALGVVQYPRQLALSGLDCLRPRATAL